MLLLGSAALHAQINTGTVFGSVTDPQGRLVPSCAITIRSTDLAQTRTVASDAHGRFAVTGLPPGAYTVEAKANGLAVPRPVRLTVTLGASTQLSLKLEVARVRQRTTVTARGNTSEGNTLAPPVNQTEAAVSSFLSGNQVTYLPLRDRDISQYDSLALNTHEDAGQTGVSLDGQRPNALATQVDGVDFTNPLLGGARGQAERGFLLPQTVVREFQIVTSGLTSETGGSSAGLVNVATKEGSGKFHGEGFYTLRPATLSSPDAFGNSLTNFASTFGGSFGGPILFAQPLGTVGAKDHSFFYAGYEQDWLNTPAMFQIAPQAPGTTLPTSFAGQQTQILGRQTPLAFSGRVDQILNAKQTLNLEFTANRVRGQNATDGFSRTLAAPSMSSSISGQSFFARAGLTSLLSPRLVNQAVVAWSSDHRNQTPNSVAPELFINGFGSFGGDALGSDLYSARQVQANDSATLVRGSSIFAFGGSFALQPAYEQREANVNARFDYDSLAAFIADAPRRFQQTFITGDTRYQATVNQLSLYAHAHFDVGPHLAMTAGLRWAAQFNPQLPVASLAGSGRSLAQTPIPDDLSQWQPRLGLAWNPRPKTVVRVSAGLYDAASPATFFHRPVTDRGAQTVTLDSDFDAQLLAQTGALVGVPRALSAVPAGVTTPSALVIGLAPNFRNPASAQAAATLEQTLSPKFTLRAGYLHESTWHLERKLDENLFAPTTSAAGLPVFPAARPIAGVGRFLVEQASAHSTYNAGTLSLAAQLTRRTSFTVNYTYAHTQDDDSSDDPYALDSALNPFNPATERAPSNLDQRHTLAVSSIFNLPLGFKFNPALLVHSGSPYTALIGLDTQNDANDFNDRALVNGVESGRNAFRGPAFSDTDLRFVKDFTLKGEGHHLDLFMDVFNLFGSPNKSFGADQVSLFGNAAAPVYSAGQPLFAPAAASLGGPREIQFTARLVAF
jgi:hypothetical protein